MHNSQHTCRFQRFPLLLLLAVFVAAPFPLSADDPKPSPIAFEARGHVVPTSQVSVSPNAAGLIVETMFEEGSKVQMGDILARVDPREQMAGVRLARAKVKLAEAELTIAKTGKADVGVAHAKLEIARAELEIAELRLESTTVRAPISGVVLTKRTGVGARVDPKTSTICDIADLSIMEVEIWVPERDIAKIKPGQTCRIRVDSLLDGMFEGTVARLQPVADKARGAVGVRVRFKAEGAGERLLPEMSAIVQFLKKD